MKRERARARYRVATFLNFWPLLHGKGLSNQDEGAEETRVLRTAEGRSNLKVRYFDPIVRKDILLVHTRPVASYTK